MDEEPRLEDDENALRLLVNADQFQNQQVTSAAFKTRPPEHPRYLPVSLFIKERLVTKSGDCLHVGKFQGAGRVSMPVLIIRNTSFESENGQVTKPFDALVTPGEAVGDLAEFADAHARLLGPTWTSGPIKALVRQVRDYGTIERPLGQQTTPAT